MLCERPTVGILHHLPDRRSWASWGSDRGIRDAHGMVGMVAAEGGEPMTGPSPSFLLIMALLATGVVLLVRGVRDPHRGIDITLHRYVAMVIGVMLWVVLNWLGWF